MHLRCSWTGLRLQEGKESLSFSSAGSTGLSPCPSPYLQWEHRAGGGESPYLGDLEYEVLPPVWSGFQDPEGCSPEMGTGDPAWGGWLGGAVQPWPHCPESCSPAGPLVP